jgi:NADH-quinone oxidoreductase subunit C
MYTANEQKTAKLPEYAEGVLALVGASFGDVATPVPAIDWPTVLVEREALSSVCCFLRDEAELAFTFLTDLTGVDWLGRADRATGQPRFEVVYHLFSLTHNRRMRLKARVPEDDPHIASVVDIWPTANFHEREVFDFYGVVFDGHPNLVKILTPDFMEGHPLRKDFPLGGEEIWDAEGGSIVQPPGDYRPVDPKGVKRFR